jgi:hypothetical protein
MDVTGVGVRWPPGNVTAAKLTRILNFSAMMQQIISTLPRLEINLSKTFTV